MCVKLRAGNRGFEHCRSTPYSVYSPETYDGHWKQLTVRTSQNGHVMAIAYFNPQVLNRDFVIRDSLHCMVIIKNTVPGWFMAQLLLLERFQCSFSYNVRPPGASLSKGGYPGMQRLACRGVLLGTSLHMRHVLFTKL